MTRGLATAALTLILALGAAPRLHLLAAGQHAASRETARPPRVEAGAAVVMDTRTGTVLFGKQVHQRRPIASTTKIMTALLALEADRLDESVTISPRAAKAPGSSLHLQPGDVKRMDDLLAALLLKSANDAAVAIAEHLEGSVAEFSRQMNLRARQLGATDTKFHNPHGLYHPEHYSSAHDLSLMTREAMKDPYFRRLVNAKSVTIRDQRGPDGRLRLVNHNKLLWRDPSVDGVKTGYVRQSGHCLVASATRDGWQLIAVVLDSPDTYAEAQRLLDYGFATYRSKVYARAGDAVGQVRVKGSIKRHTSAVCPQTLSAVTGPGLPSAPRLEVSLHAVRAPVTEGDPVGEARLLAGDDRTLAHSALLAGESVSRSTFLIALMWILRVLVILLLATLLAKTYAKTVKAHRRRWAGLPPEGR
jgi:D-alanyl-D-alanine carboxypeptidase (penicillin-binding protein 5/6)